MAESNSYPMLSANNWWNIRKKFKQTIPGTVTASYLSSVLNMQERSATNNIMPYLRQLGIIDAEGKTGERAKLWRDDIDYPKVCDEIRRNIPAGTFRYSICNRGGQRKYKKVVRTKNRNRREHSWQNFGILFSPLR